VAAIYVLSVSLQEVCWCAFFDSHELLCPISNVFNASRLSYLTISRCHCVFFLFLQAIKQFKYTTSPLGLSSYYKLSL
jgi:hypothetical protein